MKANPLIIKQWAERKKCLMCKHGKDEGHMLPRGKYWPSPAWLFHYQDTHGLDHQDTYMWIFQSAYQTEDGVSALRLFNEWAFNQQGIKL